MAQPQDTDLGIDGMLVQDGKYARELSRVMREAGQQVPPQLESMSSFGGGGFGGGGSRWGGGGRGGGGGSRSVSFST